MKLALIALIALIAPIAPIANAQQPAKAWPAMTDGFIPFHYDEPTGKLLLEVSHLNQDILYLYSLATGLGSNALGLDRGTTGGQAVVQFQKYGPRIFMVQRNLDFRATNGDSALVRSVTESFATSVLASFPIQAEENGKYVVDATDFLLQDIFNVRGTIQRAQQGAYRLDRTRSAVYLPRTKAFPKNTEVEALLTFESDAPGDEVARHTPDARAMTLREHHSFVELPDNKYHPRALDPRVGVFATDFYDFSLPLNREPRIHWINRWRLEKKDPSAALSDPVKPIVYYLDPGVPEPYRTAFKQGGAWWSKVFEAAGFRNAFRVEDLPYDVDPMDARYSVIQWVHRSDPGFSVGQSFSDPRTGEILKGALKMDSYRSMTDYNIFAGMIPALSDASDGTEFAMARRRQHIAHEIGHTLGLAHNYISHAYGRASVMDYPGPLVTLRANGTVDVSDAFRAGAGAYDSLAIRYAYTEFPGDEQRGLDAIAHEAIAKGIRFLYDRDANAGTIAEVTRWLNGNDAVAELERTTKVRAVLLAKFNDSVIANGDPMYLLNKRLAPVYLHHRYAIEAAIKAVGGMEYTFAVKGDGQTPTQIVDPAKQRRALKDLLSLIQPAELAIPEPIIAKLPPTPFGLDDQDWGFASPAGAAFDPVAVARALASYVANGLLEPQRVERLVAFHARNPAAPSALEVMSTMVNAVYAPLPNATSYQTALLRASRRAVVDALLSLAANQNTTADARAAAEYTLNALSTRVATTNDDANASVVRDIRNWLDKRIAPPRAATIQLPPGTPIGN